MRYEDWKYMRRPQWESVETEEPIALRPISPGKRTLTMSLPPRPVTTLASAQAPVQRKADRAAVMRRKEQAMLTEQWMDVALRPDLHDAPVQHKSTREKRKEESSSLPVSGSQPMPDEVQAKMEAAFGADFSEVRIHEGPEAPAMGALAYTQGTDIHFAPGQYDPGSHRGQELLGHELTHVVQQSQGRVQATAQLKGVNVNDDVGLEREADDMGARAARGQAVHDAVANDTGQGGRTPPLSRDTPIARTPSAGTSSVMVISRFAGSGALQKQRDENIRNETEQPPERRYEQYTEEERALLESAVGTDAFGEYLDLEERFEKAVRRSSKLPYIPEEERKENDQYVLASWSFLSTLTEQLRSLLVLLKQREETGEKEPDDKDEEIRDEHEGGDNVAKESEDEDEDEDDKMGAKDEDDEMEDEDDSMVRESEEVGEQAEANDVSKTHDAIERRIQQVIGEMARPSEMLTTNIVLLELSCERWESLYGAGIAEVLRSVVRWQVDGIERLPAEMDGLQLKMSVLEKKLKQAHSEVRGAQAQLILNQIVSAISASALAITACSGTGLAILIAVEGFSVFVDQSLGPKTSTTRGQAGGNIVASHAARYGDRYGLDKLNISKEHIDAFKTGAGAVKGLLQIYALKGDVDEIRQALDNVALAEQEIASTQEAYEHALKLWLQYEPQLEEWRHAIEQLQAWEDAHGQIAEDAHLNQQAVHNAYNGDTGFKEMDLHALDRDEIQNPIETGGQLLQR